MPVELRRDGCAVIGRRVGDLTTGAGETASNMASKKGEDRSADAASGLSTPYGEGRLDDSGEERPRCPTGDANHPGVARPNYFFFAAAFFAGAAAFFAGAAAFLATTFFAAALAIFILPRLLRSLDGDHTRISSGMEKICAHSRALLTGKWNSALP